MDEAIECYTRAANMFKMAKKWSSAGKAFVEAANLHIKSGTKHDAACNLLDAANCFKKTDNKGIILGIPKKKITLFVFNNLETV